MPRSRSWNHWTTQVDRRRFLRGSLIAGAGLSAAALVGCGDSDEASPSSGTPATGGGSSTSTSSSGGGQPDTSSLGYTFQDAGGTPKDGGTLVMALANDMGSFDATKSGAIGNLTHINTVYDTLFEWRRTTDASELDSRDLDNDILGRLVESFETPDGQAYTFNLRRGVQWQDRAPLGGRDFTAEDVLYALNRFASEGVWQPTFADVVSMEAPDDHTVLIQLTQPDPDFLVPLAEQNLSIQPRELVDDGSIDGALVGTGPFIAEDITPGQGVTYVRNENFWGKRPHIDGLDIRVIPDVAARLAAFRSGQIDHHAVNSLVDLETLRSADPAINAFQSRYVKAVFHMAFNLEMEKYADERVRRAIALGIDHDEINEILYEGNSPVRAVIPYNHIFSSEDEVDYGPYLRTYDPDEAVSLLQAAGQENLVIPQLIYRAYVQDQNDLWVDQLRRIGVDLQLQAADYVEFNSQLAGISWAESIGAWDQHGTQANNYFRGQLVTGSPANWSRISDPDIDQWAQAQAVELDPEARREIQRQIWDKLLDQVYRVEYCNNVAYQVVSPRVKGISWSVGNDGLAGSWTGYSKNVFLSDIWLDA